MEDPRRSRAWPGLGYGARTMQSDLFRASSRRRRTLDSVCVSVCVCIPGACVLQMRVVRPFIMIRLLVASSEY